MDLHKSRRDKISHKFMLWLSHVIYVERQTDGQTDRLAHVYEDLKNLRCTLRCDIPIVPAEYIILAELHIRPPPNCLSVYVTVTTKLYLIHFTSL